MLFADIIGCSEISNHKSLAAYNKFLDQFHAIFDEVTEEHKKTWYAPQDQPYFKAGVRGDEGCLMIFIPGRDEA
ncbi:MAG TPA: hypothetical protein VNM91_07375, partial [Dehalococcoidia bacterium]|nr:hypothetical protein [Dehalococcoidia bacterium]